MLPVEGRRAINVIVILGRYKCLEGYHREGKADLDGPCVLCFVITLWFISDKKHKMNSCL